jgi:hypothetical protein
MVDLIYLLRGDLTIFQDCRRCYLNWTDSFFNFFGNAFRSHDFLWLLFGTWFFCRMPLIFKLNQIAIILLCFCSSVLLNYRSKALCSCHSSNMFYYFFLSSLLLPCTWSSIRHVPLAGVLHIKDVRWVLWPCSCQDAIPNSFYCWTI